MTETTLRDTKDRILDAAEELFADHGFAASSLRAITTTAEVNLAAVNYHFGSKEELLGAVLERRMGPINRERIEILDRLEAEAGSNPVAIEALVDAMLRPAFSAIAGLGGHGARFVRLMARTHVEPNADLRARFLEMFAEVIERYTNAFRRALPHLGDHELHWRLHFLVGAMAHTLASAQHEGCVQVRGAGAHESGDVLESLVRFATFGLQAPAEVEA